MENIKLIPNYGINIHCDKILYKKILMSVIATPKLIVYKVDRNLIDSKSITKASSFQT
jgi:hypothetical protein